jgi:hypothetical protein
MWICSKLGFFSIVKKGEPGTWQVRARRKNDLQELLESTGLEETEIVSTPDHDYGFRIMVDQEDLETVFACLAESIDYPNFKNCIASLPAQRDKLPAYHQFWDGMLKVQQAAPDHDDSQSAPTIKPAVEARTAEDIVVQQIGWLSRMLQVIGEFRAGHGQWPTRLRLPINALMDLKQQCLTEAGFHLLQSKLQLVVDEGGLAVEDDGGQKLPYSGKGSGVGVDEWLWGVSLCNTPKPFDRAYWAASGRLLAGCYPGDLDPEAARRKLQSLIDCGVGKIINLTGTTEVGTGGKPFVDYRPLLEELARKAGQVIQVERLPIHDMRVPTPDQMKTILDKIDDANDNGQAVYVHCWGGKGRTGMVVGCYLARHGLALGEAALKRLNELTKAATYDFGYVPQTPEQCAFVRNWKESQ